MEGKCLVCGEPTKRDGRYKYTVRMNMYCSYKCMSNSYQVAYPRKYRKYRATMLFRKRVLEKLGQCEKTLAVLEARRASLLRELEML